MVAVTAQQDEPFADGLRGSAFRTTPCQFIRLAGTSKGRCSSEANMQRRDADAVVSPANSAVVQMDSALRCEIDDKLWPLLETGQCVAWIGPGLSVALGYKRWRATIDELCTQCG